MEFNEQSSQQNSIISIEENTVVLSHSKLNTPCFISRNNQFEIDINNVDQIDKSSVFPLCSKDDINLLIVGTGKEAKFLHPKQLVSIQQMGIGIESMKSDSACRSFNLLLSDARPVGLILL